MYSRFTIKKLSAPIYYVVGKKAGHAFVMIENKYYDIHGEITDADFKASYPNFPPRLANKADVYFQLGHTISECSSALVLAESIIDLWIEKYLKK